MTLSLEAARAQAARDFDQSVARLCALLRIPSVGTDPAHRADTRRAAEWLARELAGLGLVVAVEETDGHPVVWARGGSGRPHVLYYGHYDVQPPDPLEEWRHPPFEPATEEGPFGPRLVARGAVDNKGQLMTMIEALRAVRTSAGELPCSITFLIEGEEESGSPNLAPYLRRRREELAADVAVISDTTMLGPDRPAITQMLRGLLYVELQLTGAAVDLHSGLYGGVAPNPIHALARMIASLHDDRGRIQIPGLYDTVRELDPQQQQAWREIGFDVDQFLGAVGITRAEGEEGFTVVERLWARPTLDVNGIWGGYTGAGQKTVIPAQAFAELSLRLVPDQDPETVLAQLRQSLEARTPQGYRLEIRPLAAAAPIRIPAESPFFRAAERALGRVFPNPPARIGCGGTIPVVAMLKEELGIDTLLIGFGLDDDGPHSPNEKFDLICYRRGIESHIALLQELVRDTS